MGLTKNEAKKLADQILKTPDKTARLKGNMEDLQAKLNSAKAKLGKVPDSRKAKVRADIADLQRKIAQAKAALDAMDGRTATTYLKTVYSPAGHTGPGGIPKFAKGGKPAAGWALVGEEGPELVRFKGGEQVYDHRSSMRMASPLASAQPVIGRPAVVGGGAGARPVQIQIDVHGAMDPVAVGRELQRVLLQLKRTQGVNVQLGVG
jgi:phage-related tail protein